MKTRMLGGLCLLGGIVLEAIVWNSVIHDGHYSLKAAAIAPILIVFGVGFLIHGEAMPPRRATPLLRGYGIVGSLCTIAQLYYFGFFAKGPVEIALGVFLVGIWFLPARFFEGRGAPAGESSPSASSPGRSEPISPRPIE